MAKMTTRFANFTREQMDKERKAAEVAASDAYYAQNEAYAFSSEESAGSYVLERHNGAARAACAARDVILNEWYLTPQGAEEKRLAEEAERRRMEEKQALAEACLAEKQAKHLAYAKSQGFDTVIAYIDYVNSTWRYCHKNPWVSWLTCVRQVQVPEWW
jgi:hypothetical protein